MDIFVDFSQISFFVLIEMYLPNYSESQRNELLPFFKVYQSELAISTSQRENNESVLIRAM